MHPKEQRDSAPFRLQAQSTLQVRSFEEAALNSLLTRSLAGEDTAYPCYRARKMATTAGNQKLLENLSRRTEWQVQRPDHVTLVLRAPGAFAIFIATGNSTVSTASYTVWAENEARANDFAAIFQAEVGAFEIRDPSFRLEWRFLNSRGLGRAFTVERPNDVLVDEAYPVLTDGVQAFIDRFLAAPESVLVLQGPPGGGKTRLIRAIMREIALRKTTNDEDSEAVALYSGDKGVWEMDEIFVDFITSSYDAFLIEDADHLMAPRADGNQTLHRFLNISDGIAQAQGRKIIFSTNLPNVGDIDDALVRPGRCFAHLFLRNLQPGEAHRLLQALCADDRARLERACNHLERMGKPTIAVADIYAAFRGAKDPSTVGTRHLRVANS